MIPVSDIWDEVTKLAGNCSTEVRYRKLNRAVEILANKSDWDPLTGFMDIACDERLVTLPREIETPLAISYGNYPALGRDQLFRFHLNGPGDKDTHSGWRWWEDRGEAVTLRDIGCTPVSLAVVACNPADAESVVWVYGYDENNKWVRSEQDGVMVDGYPFPAQQPFIGGDPFSPSFSRIERVRKPVTNNQLELWTVGTVASSGGSGSGSGEGGDGSLTYSLETLLSIYSWDDTEPKFRRLYVDRVAELVRIHFRRKNFKLRSVTDLIPLHNAEAVVMMVRALKYYDEIDFPTATACEATAVRWLEEEQKSRNPSIMTPIQVVGLGDHDDYYIH